MRMARFLVEKYFSGKLLSYLTCVQLGAQAGAKVKMRPEKIDETRKRGGAKETGWVWPESEGLKQS